MVEVQWFINFPEGWDDFTDQIHLNRVKNVFDQIKLKCVRKL